MMKPSILVFLASATIAARLPHAIDIITDNNDNRNVIGGLGKNAYSNPLLGRGIFAPIATDSAADIAGGEVTNGSPPLSSFFDGLKPPVLRTPSLETEIT